MKPRVKQQDSGMEDLFRSKLKSIINLRHELVRLGELIDWARLEAHFAPYYKEAGRPGLAIRLLVGLHLLKHIEGLSDEAVCARWERDPYMQYFCGEEYFQHAFPLERSGMTHFRNRVGEQALEALLQETLAAACGAACGDENGALPARPAKEARAASVEIYARAAAAADPRRAPQDANASCFIRAHRETAGQRARPRLAYGAPEARRPRLSLFLARAGSGVHQQRQ